MILGAAAIQGSYTEGVLPIHINDLNCTGSEERVWECPHNGIAGYSCNHYQDASVICQESKKSFFQELYWLCNLTFTIIISSWLYGID